ncbi:MAG: class I SAM-dependent methyltransferase [Alphaproteobacteria bacterium]|nr:class I SAM-dependent methyltransferase [Alphaproteobacteria bacterium]
MTLRTCPICRASDFDVFLRREGVPVDQNKVYRTREEARACQRGDITMALCKRCAFVWNQTFEDSPVVYDQNYENDQTHSPAFRAHVEDMAARVLAAMPADAPLDVVEVGSGQGTFLKCLKDMAGPRLRSATGFDPAFRGAEGGSDALQFYRRYFGNETRNLLPHEPNVIVTRHTIEHVTHPLAFLSDIRSAIPANGTRIFIETPCIAWTIDNVAFQDFGYEHCSVFTTSSLTSAMQLTGFSVDKAEHAFGGQYLWASGATAGSPGGLVTPDKLPDSRRYATIEAEMRTNWRKRIADAPAGKVAIWGAGGKGATFAMIIDPAGELLNCAIDINPKKAGTFLPAVGLPVVTPSTAAERGITTAIVMNPNYLEEIARDNAAKGFTPKLIPLE